MEKSSKLTFSDVTSTTKDICKFVTGEDYTVAYIDLYLRDKGDLKEYTSVVACREDDYKDLVDEVLSFDGMNKDKYSINPKYCHIATFESHYYLRHPISFDSNDDCPIKADINEEYGYVDAFFRRFIDFRNRLIENGEVVKDDDIYQYFLVLSDGLERKNKPKLRDRIAKVFIKK